MSNETEQKLFNFLQQEFGVTVLQSDMREIELIVRSDDEKTLTELEAERLTWSLKTFTEATHSYKGFVGQLLDNGTYIFLGFSPPITTLPDLRYMLMLIDYQHESSFSGYPSSDN